MLFKYSAQLFSFMVFASAGFAQEMAPDFTGVDMRTDQTITLSDFRGKVVLVDFWASWCPPCLLSLPAYDKMREEIGTAEFEIIAVNVDENSGNGLEFLQDHPVAYPVLADPEGDIGIPYKLRSLPVSFLLDRSGRIVRQYRSFSLGDEIALKQEIDALLEE